MRTTKYSAYPIRELVGSKRPVWLYHLSLAVNPLRLDGMQPRALLGQKRTHDPHPLAAFLNSTVVRSEPGLTSLETCQEALSQMRTTTFLPAALSFSAHHERNRVVMELMGLPSTNLSHVSSSPGR